MRRMPFLLGMIFGLAGACGNVDPTAYFSDGGGPPGLDGAALQCEGECSLQAYTACTCDPSDPCGWGGDGWCDQLCIDDGVVPEMFDDGEDCIACQTECAIGFASSCTCAPTDPCGWAGDGHCDAHCVWYGHVEEMFDDDQDCSGVCDNACDVLIYTVCTCGVDDPCGWAGDGECDAACLEQEGVEEMFDDDRDCGEAAALAPGSGGEPRGR